MVKIWWVDMFLLKINRYLCGNNIQNSLNCPINESEFITGLVCIAKPLGLYW